MLYFNTAGKDIVKKINGFKLINKNSLSHGGQSTRQYESNVPGTEKNYDIYR